MKEIKSDFYYDEIVSLLIQYMHQIVFSSSVNRNNRAVDAENTFRLILNITFNWNLENANKTIPNQAGYDLFDSNKSVYVQVTSDSNQLKKYRETLSLFSPQNYPANSNLIILFISDKLSRTVKDSSNLSGYCKVYNISTLYKVIYYLPNEKLKLIYDILKREVPSYDPVQEGLHVPDTNLPPQTLVKPPTGISISRKKLVSELYEFGRSGNGLIIGDPGMGKSFCIDSLQIFCNKIKVPCFIIRINELLEGTDEEIGRSLKTSANWINAFRNVINTSDKSRGLLIFDAFDTAKEEKIKENLLKQVKKAISELSDRWIVLVSTRTFDAYHSSRLLEMFPKENINNKVYCRHFSIMPLSDSELKDAIQSSKIVKTQYNNAQASIKELLKVPYFLKLFESIVTDRVKISGTDWSHIETEEQLLNFFWDSKVKRNEQTEIFLQAFTEMLTADQNLSCKKSKIVSQDNRSTFEHLTSLQILKVSAATGQTISFTHNILLDFAISKYLIPEDKTELCQYLETYPKRPFLFRQAFVYFYSRLWRLDRPLFWEHYFAIQNIQTPLHRLFQQSILTYTIVNSYQVLPDLEPLLEKEDSEAGKQCLLKLLQGIRFSNKTNLSTRHFLLFFELSKNIHSRFIWDLGYLINASIDYLETKPNNSSFQLIQKASQNYLEFVLKERLNPENKWMIDANASTWAVQNICRTFRNSHRSKKLVGLLLTILKEDDFPIQYFRALDHSIKYLFQSAPVFGVTVFKTLYAHHETSDKKTPLGNSVVASFTSNRRQDFQMIHYSLEKAFPDFLQLAPLVSARLGIDIINQHYVKTGIYSIDSISFPLTINGEKAKIIPDLSAYDYIHDDESGTISFAKAIFGFLENKILENNGISDDLIKIVIGKGQASLLWSRLLKLITRYPEKLKTTGYGILQNKSVYLCDNTVHEVGELIRSLWEFLTDSERKEIEKVILSLQNSDLQEPEASWTDEKIARLLNCIPGIQITQQTSKEILVKYGNLPNPPIMKYGGLRPYDPGPDEKVSRMGADLNNEIEMSAYRLIERLSSFNARYNFNSQGLAPRPDFEPFMPAARELFVIAGQNNFNKKLQFHCDYEIAHFCQILSKLRAELHESERQFVEEIAFHYLNLPEYKNVAFEQGNMQRSFGLGGDHPRFFACQSLIELVDSDTSGKLLKNLLPLFRDPMQVIRLECNRRLAWLWNSNRAEYWSIIEERINLETDALCLNGVILSTTYNDIIAKDQTMVEAIAKLMISRLIKSEEKPADELWSLSIQLLLKLLLYQSKIALEKIQENLHHRTFAKVLIFNLFTFVDPHDEENDYVNQPDQNKIAFDILQNCLQVHFDHIEQHSGSLEQITEDFEVLDSFVQHLNFTLERGRASNKGKSITEGNKKAFYFKSKPLIQLFIQRSLTIENGFIVSHTGYYLLEMLNRMLYADPAYVLSACCDIVRCASTGGITYDHATLQEIIKLTQQLLADHKSLLYDAQNFFNLLMILDQFAESGWQEALEFTWKLKDIF